MAPFMALIKNTIKNCALIKHLNKTKARWMWVYHVVYVFCKYNIFLNGMNIYLFIYLWRIGYYCTCRVITCVNILYESNAWWSKLQPCASKKNTAPQICNTIKQLKNKQTDVCTAMGYHLNEIHLIMPVVTEKMTPVMRRDAAPWGHLWDD